MAKSGIFSTEGRPVSSHVLLLCNADVCSYSVALPNHVFIMVVFLFVASVDVGEVARILSSSSLPWSLMVRCLYRPGEFFGQLIGWFLQLAVTGLRRRHGWIRVGHRRHAGHRDQPSANLQPLARSWKTSLSDHAQSCRTADSE
jgi:hypothetical protein